MLNYKSKSSSAQTALDECQSGEVLHKMVYIYYKAGRLPPNQLPQREKTLLT